MLSSHVADGEQYAGESNPGPQGIAPAQDMSSNTREEAYEQEGTTMSEIPSSAQTYALGHTPEAFQRLLVQGQLFNPLTRRLLEDAGLQAGMHVLDVG